MRPKIEDTPETRVQRLIDVVIDQGVAFGLSSRKESAALVLQRAAAEMEWEMAKDTSNLDLARTVIDSQYEFLSELIHTVIFTEYAPGPREEIQQTIRRLAELTATK